MIRILPEAREELLATAQWYEVQRPGLGVEFLLEMDSAVQKIAAHPEAWAAWRPDRPYRKKILHRFPYVIFFVLQGPGDIEVAAVAHVRRRPGYWTKRTS